MMKTPSAFKIERENGLLIVSPLVRISELSQPNISAEFRQLVEMVKEDSIDHVLVDFGNVDYFGSAMLEILIELRKHAGNRPDSLALCNLSDYGREVLRIARFNKLCKMFDTREDYFDTR